MELLNIVGKGDISKEDFDTIYKFFIQCLRGVARNKQGIQTLTTSNRGVTKVEIRNLLDNLRTDIMSTLSSQLDTLPEQHKQMELEKTMAIFCPQCKKRHPLKECPLNTVEACAICEQSHSTNSCPSLPGLKSVFEGENEEVDQLYFMGSKKPWQLQPPNVNQGMC